jgi:hypothetical protein
MARLKGQTKPIGQNPPIFLMQAWPDKNGPASNGQYKQKQPYDLLRPLTGQGNKPT